MTVQVNFCGIVSDKPSKKEEYPIKGLKSKNHLVAAAADTCTQPRSASALLGRPLGTRRLLVGSDAESGGDATWSAPAQTPEYIARALEEVQRLQRLQPASDAAEDVAEESGVSPDDGGEVRRRGRALLATSSPSVTPAPILSGSIDNVWVALSNGRLATSKCYEHKHCKQGNIPDPFRGSLGNWGGGPGQFCAKDNLCYTCGDCQDDADAVDGKCPQDLCPGSGKRLQRRWGVGGGGC